MNYLHSYGTSDEDERKIQDEKTDPRALNAIKQLSMLSNMSSEFSSFSTGNRCNYEFNTSKFETNSKDYKYIYDNVSCNKTSIEENSYCSRLVEPTNITKYNFDRQYKEFNKAETLNDHVKRNSIYGRLTAQEEIVGHSVNKINRVSKQCNKKNSNTDLTSFDNISTKETSINCSTPFSAENTHRLWLDSEEPGLPVTQCYLPKKMIHRWSGHQNGVQKIIWLPASAHLLLSAGLDGKIKIWNVFKNRKCLATYMGHNMAVRDITFSNDGKTFVSSGFDKNIKVWDTETGKVKCVIKHNKMGFSLRIHPDTDKQHVLLVGCSDRKIYQFDINTGDIVQEYDRHLDAVNSITFVNHDRWFLTTSDDKTIRVWEYGIPEQIKYIADPSLHSMPYVEKAPDSKWLLMQCMDNCIQTYGANQRISVNRKKLFTGHNNAGYSCQVGMSPDGRFVLSGDGHGRCYFWDWKTTRLTRSIKAHKGACIGAIWHPLETSKIATCSWEDTYIKYWD